MYFKYMDDFKINPCGAHGMPITRNYVFLLLSFIFLTGTGVSTAFGNATVSIYEEAFGNNIAGREAAEKLDDIWANQFEQGTFSPDLFANGVGHTGTKHFSDINGAAYQVDWKIGYIDIVGPGTPTSIEFIHTSSGTVTYSPSNTIQGKSPNPYPDQSRLSAGFSSPGLSAVQLDFSQSTTPITDFGIYVGDLESRPKNGTVGRVLVYDISGVLINDQPIIYTGRVLNGIDYTVVEAIGLPSGASNNDSGDWGNDTTAFISITSSQLIGKVVFHVGDDDHTGSNNGASEQIGLVGFQLPISDTGEGSSAKTIDTSTLKSNDLTLRKTVENITRGTLETEEQNQAVPGDVLKYRIYYQNVGTSPLTELEINDTVQAFTEFNIGSAQCDETPSTVTCNPVESSHDVEWQFSGQVNGGDGGVVSFEVIID